MASGNFFGGQFFGGGFFGALGPTPAPPNPIRDGGGGAQAGYGQRKRRRIEQDEADIADIIKQTMPYLSNIVRTRRR